MPEIAIALPLEGLISIGITAGKEITLAILARQDKLFDALSGEDQAKYAMAVLEAEEQVLTFWTRAFEPLIAAQADLVKSQARPMLTMDPTTGLVERA